MHVLEECPACSATGVYCGFAEPQGTGVICIQCDGTGCVKHTYRPFVERRLKRGVQLIQYSGGRFIATGVGPTGASISYKDFLAGKRPK